jgi:hypothetical protein
MSVERLAQDAEFQRLVRAGKASKEIEVLLPGHGAESTYSRARRKVLGLPHRPDVAGRGNGLRVERLVSLSDIHIPYQDQRAVEISLSFIKDWQPQWVVLNGDILDAPQLSRFDHDPQRQLQLQEDLDKLYRFFDALVEAAPTARRVFTGGNHENRIIRWLWQHPEVSNLRVLRPEELFRLKDWGIEWMPYGQAFDHHGFLFVHGDVVRKHSSYTAKAMLEKYGTSGCSGHTHRLGQYLHRDHGGMKGWWEQGCLCELNPTYLNGPADWCHGIGVGEFVPGSGRFYFTVVPIIDHRLLWQGKLY